MKAEIRQWDGQLAVCFPQAIATEIHLQEGMNVEIEVVNGKLTISPTTKEYNLNEMLARITSDNLHEEVDTGNAVGQEVG